MCTLIVRGGRSLKVDEHQKLRCRLGGTSAHLRTFSYMKYVEDSSKGSLRLPCEKLRLLLTA